MNNGVADVYGTKYILEKLQEAGFEILEARDHDDDGDLPW